MPFLKKNKVNMTVTKRGDSIEFKATQVPIDMITEEFYGVWPAGESAYEGSGKQQSQWGGGTEIVPQAAYKVAHHLVLTHGKNLGHAPHGGPHSTRSHVKSKDRMTQLKDSDDEDDALQKALAESVKNMALNSRNERNNQQDKLQKPQPGSSISKSVAPRAAAKNNNSLKLPQSGRSVEDMARLTSVTAAEISRKEEQRKRETDSFSDEDLDRIIALNLKHIERDTIEYAASMEANLNDDLIDKEDIIARLGCRRTSLKHQFNEQTTHK